MNSPTNTQNIAANDFSSIYNEAILFFAIFALMGIISFIISRKNAKKYERSEERRVGKECRL